MTVTSGQQTAVEKSDLVTLTIDGIEVSVPKGTLVIRAAEMVGVQIPRFCDHPLLDPIGACRQCLVEIPDAGNGRGMPKPQPSCTITVAPGMVVNTQATSPVADKAQQGIMEFLLINHPLDCPVCDKGGECPLQNQSMSNGRGETRFEAKKRTFPKPINISAQILLDRDRCVLCARCTRFSDQIAGDPFLMMLERGALQQVGIYEKEPFASYFSGNTIQICPVGALTSASYRFRSRPFDLISTPSIAELDGCGSAIRVDHRRGKVMRRLSGNDPEVNEEWITDKDRFAFLYARRRDRLTTPLVRDEALPDGTRGELRVASWPEAFAVAARGLQRAGAVGVLTGGRVTVEDAYAYSKFARLVLGTNDIDFRARPHSADEAEFLATSVVGNRSVSYHDLEEASVVVLVGLEPEDEAGTIFLRLRKAASHGTSVYSVAPYSSWGLRKMKGTLLPTAPGFETETIEGLSEQVPVDANTVFLVGERLATVPGALAAVSTLARTRGAKLAWVPRRAGDRGAVEVGVLPGLLPGGRRVADDDARADLASHWGVSDLPATPGRDGDAIVAATAAGELGGLVVGGVDPADLADPGGARAALAAASFVVSLEIRESEVTRVADVVFPVAPVTEKAGSFHNWEGRNRPFEQVLHVPSALPDLRILAGIADEMGVELGFRSVPQVREELERVGLYGHSLADEGSPDLTSSPAQAAPAEGTRSFVPQSPAMPGPQPPPERPEPGMGEVAAATTRASSQGSYMLASWKQMVDDGRMQDGDQAYLATGRKPVLLVNEETLRGLGVDEGAGVVLSGPLGSLTLPVRTADLVEGVVWAPASARGASVRHLVGPAGCTVTVAAATAELEAGGQA